MALHIKKIIDGMLIFNVLSNNLARKFRNISIINQKDCFVLDIIDKSVISRLYEVHKLLLVSGGSMKLFGVNQNVSLIIAKSEVGPCLNVQFNEILDIDFIDLLRFKQFILAS